MSYVCNIIEGTISYLLMRLKIINSKQKIHNQNDIHCFLVIFPNILQSVA